MSRPRWARVTAVMAATLAGGALVAFLVVPREAPSGDPVGAGLARPGVSGHLDRAPDHGAGEPRGERPGLPSLRQRRPRQAPRKPRQRRPAWPSLGSAST